MFRCKQTSVHVLAGAHSDEAYGFPLSVDPGPLTLGDTYTYRHKGHRDQTQQAIEEVRREKDQDEPHTTQTGEDRVKVLDLFAGLGGWSAAFRDHGHEVWTVDNDPKFGCSETADIMSWQGPPFRPDVILASPPCEAFSVASIGTHWGGGHRAYEPQTETARTAIKLVKQTLRIIELLEPAYWIIENPRGVLRKLGLLPGPVTIWQCHYGSDNAKPTDLWTNIPMRFEPPCHNNRGHGPSCCCSDHEKAPRGAKTGTQGLSSPALRAVIPYGLSRAVRDGLNGTSDTTADTKKLREV